MTTDFDKILSASKPGDSIQLKPGLYTTLGSGAYLPGDTTRGELVKPGVSIHGPTFGSAEILCIRAWNDSASVILGTRRLW